MGLDILEIILDIEDEFSIEIDEQFLTDTKIGTLIDCVLKEYDPNGLQARIRLVEDYDAGNDHELPKKEYNKLAQKVNAPMVGMFCNRRLVRTKANIIAHLNTKISGKLTSEQIESKVINIICERLNYKGKIGKDTDMYYDLGAD